MYHETRYMYTTFRAQKTHLWAIFSRLCRNQCWLILRLLLFSNVECQMSSVVRRVLRYTKVFHRFRMFSTNFSSSAFIPILRSDPMFPVVFLLFPLIISFTPCLQRHIFLSFPHVCQFSNTLIRCSGCNSIRANLIQNLAINQFRLHLLVLSFTHVSFGDGHLFPYYIVLFSFRFCFHPT